MRKLWLGIIGLAAASTANAAVVTFHMVYNDDGTGTTTPGAFAIYATTSAADNGGLFAYGVDVNGPVLDFMGNYGQGLKFSKTTFPPNDKFAGFTTGYTTDQDKGAVTGVQDLGKTSTTVPSVWKDMIPVFGIGQEAGDLNSLKPAANPQVTDVNGKGGVYGSASGNGKTGDAGAIGNWSHGYLLGVGFTSGTITQVKFDKLSVDLKASVWASRGPAAPTDPVLPNVSVIPIVSYENLIPDTTLINKFEIVGTATGTQRATGGSIQVTGSNNKYISEVDQLTSDDNNGTASVQSIGDEAGNLFVMAKVTGTQSDVDAIIAAFNNAGGNAEAAHLHSLYDSQFGAGGFNLLYTVPNFAGAKNVNWDFTAGNTGAVINQLAVVPEPATMSLLGLGALGLLSRRRRNA